LLDSLLQEMSVFCSVLLVSTSLALSSAGPVRDNVGFMRQGADFWPEDRYATEDQQRVRRQQGRPLRRAQQGQQGQQGQQRQQGQQGQGRPNRRPQPQQEERFYNPNQQQKQRPLKPVNRQQAPVQKVQKVFKQEPAPERDLQPFESEQNTVEKEEQLRVQEQFRKKEQARKQELARKQEQARQQEQARKQEQFREKEQARKQEQFREQEQVRKQEQFRKQEQVRKQEQFRKEKPKRKQEPTRNPEIYNEVERSFDTRPAPSQVYERSATAQDSLESESIAAPAEQRDIEAAVAAGAAAYGVENYAEPQRVSFQIHGQGGPNAYKFGYDTGVGYNRQFRYEERDNYGVLHGRYGYYDQEGKLQVVTYSADPEKGFSAEGEHVPKPQYR